MGFPLHALIPFRDSLVALPFVTRASVLLYQGPTLMTSFILTYFKVLHPNIVTLGVKASNMNFKGTQFRP